MQKVLFILGPTGVGKSDLAVRLAQKYGGEIISADSVQIYKGFDIGSAKLPSALRQSVPHHLIDICEPNEYFSVADFVERTREKIDEISARGKLPIIVGGTGLYISALLGGYNFGGTEKHDEFRKGLESEISEKGTRELWNRLNSLDSDLASRIDPNNKNRIIRGLEIATFGQEQKREESPYDYLIFAVTAPRDKLYEIINKRVDVMLKKGLVKEVEKLLSGGASKDCQPMRAIGYRQVLEFLEGDLSESEMTEKIKQHSRNYAKRQMTYLRGLAKVHQVNFVDKDNDEIIERKLKEWL